MNWPALACIFNFTFVLLGAFGAHFLAARLTAQSLTIYQTAVQYGFYGSLGLLALGLAARTLAADLELPCQLLTAGVLVFCSSLFLLVALPSMRWLGAITPIGGTLMLVAWLVAALRLWRII